jgi:hypothetical protein
MISVVALPIAVDVFYQDGFYGLFTKEMKQDEPNLGSVLFEESCSFFLLVQKIVSFESSYGTGSSFPFSLGAGFRIFKFVRGCAIYVVTTRRSLSVMSPRTPAHHDN